MLFTHMDAKKWDKQDYLILWGMMNSFFLQGSEDSIISFVNWFIDYPNRGKYLSRTVGCSMRIEDVEMQMAILLIELEIYFNQKNQNVYFIKAFSDLWHMGERFFQREETFIGDFLDLNSKFGTKSTVDIEVHIECLRSDFVEHSSRSLLIHLI